MTTKQAAYLCKLFDSCVEEGEEDLTDGVPFAILQWLQSDRNTHRSFIDWITTEDVNKAVESMKPVWSKGYFKQAEPKPVYQKRVSSTTFSDGSPIFDENGNPI